MMYQQYDPCDRLYEDSENKRRKLREEVFKPYGESPFQNILLVMSKLMYLSLYYVGSTGQQVRFVLCNILCNILDCFLA